MHQISQNSTQAPLLRLPDELILRVERYLPSVSDTLSLRLVNRRLSGVGLEGVQKRLTRLYFEPSEASIERFRHVCENSSYAAHITELVYIGTRFQMSPEEIAQDREFQSAALRFCYSEQCIEPALAAYSDARKEQIDVLASNKVSDALADCTILLPRLCKLIYLGVPEQASSRWPVLLKKQRTL